MNNKYTNESSFYACEVSILKIIDFEKKILLTSINVTDVRKLRFWKVFNFETIDETKIYELVE